LALFFLHTLLTQIVAGCSTLCCSFPSLSTFIPCHSVDAAEHVIQTLRNHWFVHVGTLDPNCPIQLWCQFLEQG
jgi:hypothetical protein